MGKKKSKQIFTVEEHETVEDCLARMKKAGFIPVRRMEEPVWTEVAHNGETEIEVSYQRIKFEGRPSE